MKYTFKEVTKITEEVAESFYKDTNIEVVNVVVSCERVGKDISWDISYRACGENGQERFFCTDLKESTRDFRGALLKEIVFQDWRDNQLDKEHTQERNEYEVYAEDCVQFAEPEYYPE